MSWQATQVRQKLNPDRVLGQWEQVVEEEENYGDY